MRALLERSRSARGSVTALAALTVVALVHSAMAGGDLGLREPANWFATQVVNPVAVPAAAPAPTPHRPARRIWAAAKSRPLLIDLRRHPGARLAAHTGTAPSVHTARRPHRSAEPPLAFARLTFVPQPPRPAIVSIYQDRTLREGDAVMMADGIRLFRGTIGASHRPGDFVRLSLVASLGWQLRQTLDALDKNPPTRWSSVDSSSG